MNEYQVPLVERLKSVPTDARFVHEEEFSSAYYPVGTLCHQAADRIAQLEKKHTTLQTQFDNLYELANSGDEMNTEPVAWLSPDKKEICFLDESVKPKNSEYFAHWMADWERLYTHPHPDDLERAETSIKLLQLKISNLEKENSFIKNNLCTPVLGPMIHGHTPEDGKASPTKPLTDEEIELVRTVLDGCVCSIKTEIEQERQAFKGYEHLFNLPSLESELKDAEKAMEILRKAQEK